MPQAPTRRSRLAEESASTPSRVASTVLRLTVSLALGPAWAAVARAASAENARWVYDAGAPWAAVAFAAAWIMPFRSVWARVLGSFASLVLGLMVFYLPYPPTTLWVWFAVIAAVFYGFLGWMRSRNVSRGVDIAVAAAVGGPFFLQAGWAVLSPYGAGEGTVVFGIAGIVVSVVTARSLLARVVAPFAAAVAGSALFAAIWAIAGSSLATELL